MKTDFSNVKWQENGKLKLLIIVGTRPEIIRLAAVINKCREYFDCILAHTGQNYDYNLNGIFFRDLKLQDPEVYLDAVGDDLGETVGNIINASYKLMAQIQPDAMLILGDTNSCLSAIPAKRLHIPIFHMETAAKTNACPKKPTAESLTSSRTSTLHTPSMHAVISQNADFRKNAPMSRVHPWRKCFTKTLLRLKQATFTLAWDSKRVSTSCSPHTVKRTSTPKRTSPVFSMQSINLRKPTICQFSIRAIHAAVTA